MSLQTPSWNCHPVECSYNPKQLILCNADRCVPAFKMVFAAAGEVIEYAAPVKRNAAGELMAWAAGDAPGEIYGFATGNADTTESADCNEICVLRRDAQLKSDGINWPEGITQAQIAAVFDDIDDRLRITVRPVV